MITFFVGFVRGHTWFEFYYSSFISSISKLGMSKLTKKQITNNYNLQVVILLI